MDSPYLAYTRRWYTPSEIGRMVGCSRQKVVRMARDGEIPSHQTPGGHWRIPASAVVRADGHAERFGAGQ